MEDFLNSAFKQIEPVKTNAVPVFIAMDVGSTQTRSCTFTKEAELGNVIILDSNYEILNRGIEHVASVDDSILSGLEMTLTDVSAESKVDPMFTEVHLIKGNLLSSVTTNRITTSSSASKIDQEATYLNIVSNIALQLLQQYMVHGQPADETRVNLTVALPPEDTRFKQRLDKFSQRLVGSYDVDFMRYGVTVRFGISANINIISEPEAVAVYQTVEKQLEGEDDSVVCVLDIGGRSTGITFIDNQHLLLDSCVTVPLGGSKLVALLGRELSSTLNIQEPQPQRLIKSLSTGEFKLGTQKVDITPQLNTVKQEFAGLIFSELSRAIDLNDIQMQNISKVFCSGHTFGEAPGSPSLMNAIAAKFQARCSFTEFSRIEGENPILMGLVYHGIIHA